MTAKKKIIISVVTLSVAIVAALGITFGVLAANRQSVANQFSVTYTATNVAATVSAKQKVKSGNVVEFSDGNSNTSVSFSVGDSTTAGSLSADNATLSVDNNFIVYQFKFVNNVTATNPNSSMTVVMTDKTGLSNDESVKSNVNVYYLASSTDYFALNNSELSYTDSARYEAIHAQTGTSITTIPANHETLPQNAKQVTTSVDAGATGYIYILVEIADNTVDAQYAAADGSISFDLTYVAPVAA